MRKLKIPALCLFISGILTSCNQPEDVIIEPYLEFENLETELLSLNDYSEFNYTSFNHILEYESSKPIDISSVKIKASWQFGGNNEWILNDFNDDFIVEKQNVDGNLRNRVEKGEISFIWCYGFGSNNYVDIEYEVETDHKDESEDQLKIRISKPSNAN